MMHSIRTTAKVAALALTALAVPACSDLDPSDPAYRAGELGNGGFAMICDDSVVCKPYSGDAAEFPKAIALSSKFRLRYIPKTSSQANIRLVDGSPPDGTFLGSVSDRYVRRNLDGDLAAIEPGYATIVARNAKGAVMDFTTIRIGRPTQLFVYDASYEGTAPLEITKVEAKAGETVTYRVFAKEKNDNLAGEIETEWESLDTSVARVQSHSSGLGTVIAEGVGATTIRISGGGFDKEIPVEVTE